MDRLSATTEFVDRLSATTELALEACAFLFRRFLCSTLLALRDTLFCCIIGGSSSPLIAYAAFLEKDGVCLDSIIIGVNRLAPVCWYDTTQYNPSPGRSHSSSKGQGPWLFYRARSFFITQGFGACEY